MTRVAGGILNKVLNHSMLAAWPIPSNAGSKSLGRPLWTRSGQCGREKVKKLTNGIVCRQGSGFRTESNCSTSRHIHQSQARRRPKEEQAHLLRDTYPKSGTFGPAVIGKESDGLTRYPTFTSSKGLLRSADYFGTVVFAVSGSITAASVGMDVLGASIVGVITAIGGGTFRDSIILHKQPFWVEESEYFLMAFGAAFATFWLWPHLPEGNAVKDKNGGEGIAMVVGDAIGVGAFTCIGAQNALRLCVHPAIAAACGMVTATFGGLTRDVLCSLPAESHGSGRILHSKSDLYASTALVGSTSYIGARSVGLPVWARIAAGVGSTMALRAAAFRFDLGLPTWEQPDFKVDDSKIQKS